MIGNKEQQNVSNIDEGSYPFKVTVTGRQPAAGGSEGEAIELVTIFPGW